MARMRVGIIITAVIIVIVMTVMILMIGVGIGIEMEVGISWRELEIRSMCQSIGVLTSIILILIQSRTKDRRY